MQNRTDPVLHRTHSAVWYAWGRKDEAALWSNDRSGLASIDPFAFGEFAADQYRDMVSGAVGFCPSVQEQFAVYVFQQTGESYGGR